MTGEFLGVGLKFPPQQVGDGEFALSYYDQAIQESIWIILSTAPGERIMRSDFGCGIHDLVFAQNNTRTAGLVEFTVKQALQRWEPRIIIQQVHADPDPADPYVLLINIDYLVRETDSRFNLVYPFYLERAETA